MLRTSKAALLLLVAMTPIACVDDPDAPSRATPKPPAPDVARFVNPFIGTANASSPNPVTNGKSGAVYPGAAAPFGMVQWSPDTPKAAPPGYAWEDDHIVGFSLTHLSGAGCAAERDFPFFALVGAPDDLASEGFAHDAERASPGRYEVTLASGVEVELAATQRAGIARFTFPRSADAKVLLSGTDIAADSIFTTAFDAHFDPKSGLLTASREAGFFCAAPSTYRIHLAARFDRAPSKVYANGEEGLVESGTEVAGVHGSFAFGFDATENPVVRLRVGVSYVSVENAIANLDAEVPDFDFDGAAARTRAVWNDYLGRAIPEGGTDDQTTVFTTALYRAMLQPAVASDVNGEHIGFDKQVHEAAGWVRYQNYSGWDI